MIVLIEIRISGVNAEKVIQSVRCPKSHRVEARGFFGGIWILWKATVDVIVEINNFHFVHLKDKFPDMLDWVCFTGVYSSLRVLTKRALWEELRGVAWSITVPWLLAGDFNALFSNDEKQGGSRKGSGVCHLFNKIFNDYYLKI